MPKLKDNALENSLPTLFSIIVFTLLGFGSGAASEVANAKSSNVNVGTLLSKARSQITTNPSFVITLLSKEIATTNKSPELLFLLGRAHQEIKQDASALIYFTIAITKDPNYTKALVSRGLVRGALRDLDGAKKDFDQAILQDPRNTAALLNRGVTLGALNRADDAIKDFSECIRLEPKKSEAYRNRGISNFLLGRSKEACIDWENAERLGDHEMASWRSAYCNK